MKLLNYKGVINIGFLGTPKFSIDIINGGNFIDFGVQGANNDVERVVILKKPLIVAERERVRLVFRRTLHPLPGFNKPKSGQLVQLNSNKKLPAAPPTVPLFDSEFYDRDGIDFYIRDSKPGMANANPGMNRINFGFRCTESNVNLTF